MAPRREPALYPRSLDLATTITAYLVSLISSNSPTSPVLLGTLDFRISSKDFTCSASLATTRTPP
eukprot:Awhi_evm2s2089